MDTSVTEGRQDLVIAGFWRRLGAFVIDNLILAAIGLTLGALCFDPLARMGTPTAQLIGFAIALAYFGVLNSRLGNGQTLANRWLGIRVVNAQGQPLSLPRALLRYIVLDGLFLLNLLPIQSAVVQPASIGVLIVQALLAALVMGGSFVIVYLAIFNCRTRQSLHDLVVGSYVVRAQPQTGEAHFAHVWRGHFVVAALIALLFLGTPFAIKRFAQNEYAELLPLERTLQAQPHAMDVQVIRETRFIAPSGYGRSTFRYLTAQLRINAPMIHDAGYARGVAEILAKGDPHLAQEDMVTVTLIYGYNLGIASWSSKQIYSYKPKELLDVGSSGTGT
ncbi:RDD family protein [Rhodanobacter sp. DHG33]|uniref:RDD family protein n=1 Tax=Rhodanobacter sp. DHG33 TaxID=2775921 RepID=UPI00177C0294|nr:RDD family protein [Rhodanobacter sp. DHG33]MBD8899017.1 RDD family protein [Rhodanobacter sp. DHG33]